MTKRKNAPGRQRSPGAKVDTASLQEALEQAFPDRRWLDVLALVAHTGVADTKQIQTASGLSRDKVNTLLDRFYELAGDQVLAQVPVKVPKPGVRGRTPNLYTLGEAGAALLRANGQPDARASNLKAAKPLAHARATLDVRLAALAAGLTVETERLLPYGEEQVLRPDNVVALSNGTRALFETEQDAALPVLRRVTESVRNKAAFFRFEAGQQVSGTVRVLINLPYSRDWDKTVHVWERATAIVADECGGDLPFHILALPLQAFLQEPDWNEPPDTGRWESLFDPARTAAFEPDGQETTRTKSKALVPRQHKLPTRLKRRSPVDDRRIIQAYWQYLLEQGPELAYTHDAPRPDPAFFELTQVVYAASHPANPTPLQEAAHPYASLYLLRKYLQMHPRLRQGLSKAMVRASHSMRWNITTIEHRMQVVIDVFLRYHGYRFSSALRAYPCSSWGRNAGPGDFGVSVGLHRELLMEEGYGVVPDREQVQEAEAALAWVLWALFAHSEYLQVKSPPFW